MLNTTNVKSLSTGGEIISLETINDKVETGLSYDDLQGSNGISVSKTADNKVEVKIGKGFTVKNEGAYNGTSIGTDFISISTTGNSALELKPATITLRGGAGPDGLFLTQTSIQRRVFNSGLTSYDFLDTGNVKTIGGQSIYGSGDIAVGDKEYKMRYGDTIYGGSGYSGSITIDTSTSNLQDKTITALWVRAGNANADGNGGDDGYSYQISIQDLYNSKASTSTTQGDFSYNFNYNIKIKRGSAITTSYSNGTQNYIIPISFEGLSTSSYYLQFGFIYKGNAFAGSDVY